jgi:UDP-GlcNAc3NAcA epimerase
MYDNTLFFSDYARKYMKIVDELVLQQKDFILATVHRPSNTDIPENLNSIFRAFLRLVRDQDLEIVLPIHPRTKKLMEENLDIETLNFISGEKRIHIIDPVSFLEMTHLEDRCAMVITDSGGVQKEAYFLKKPCIVLREQTEWVELLETGTCLLSGADEDQIVAAWKKLSFIQNAEFPNIFGDGRAAEFIVKEMVRELG